MKQPALFNKVIFAKFFFIISTISFFIHSCVSFESQIRGNLLKFGENYAIYEIEGEFISSLVSEQINRNKISSIEEKQVNIPE